MFVQNKEILGLAAVAACPAAGNTTLVRERTFTAAARTCTAEPAERHAGPCPCLVHARLQSVVAGGGRQP